ncbi:MAG: cardiolipin synthase ClsB [Panacagrimonas sp.]
MSAKMAEATERRFARSSIWKEGHRIELLENGEEFFPRVNQAIAVAQVSVIIETFILFEDEIGLELHKVMCEAARRGVRVDITVDGYGSSELSPKFIADLAEAGVCLHVFDPRPTLLGVRTNLFRRLHRKIVVVDERVAFVGGINYSIDHIRKFGPEAKQDYAIQIEGPVVDDINALAESFIRPAMPVRRLRFPWWRRRASLPIPSRPAARVGNAAAALIDRDNESHRDDIERHYIAVLRASRQRVIIANAYFVPGYRLLRAIRQAARRGVDVQLILQGRSDKWITQWAAEILYDWLQAGGVKIFEYCERPLHGKVAVVDDEWSTVGSSNLDPLSLSLNLEANVMILDKDFNTLLASRLEHLMRHSCKEVVAHAAPVRTWGKQIVTFVLFHFLRRYPAWGGWLPAHKPRIRQAAPPALTESVATSEA